MRANAVELEPDRDCRVYVNKVLRLIAPARATAQVSGFIFALAITRLRCLDCILYL